MRFRPLGIVLATLFAIVLPARAQTNNQPVTVNPGVAPAFTPAPKPAQVVIQPGPTITGQPNNQPLQINPQLAPRSGNSGGLLLAPPMGPITIEHAGLLCSDPALLNKCGYETADKLGTYKLNMHCDQGFYDPIWGGTCWKCPDGTGWLRSANNVQNDDACWRVPPETTASAQRIKNATWAWDCPSGTFWDMYNGGACWKCPDDHPRRTLYAVWDSRACATSVNETSPATFLNYNGCPSVQQALANNTLTLGGKRLPGRPFLDIGAGWAAGQASGACYACPSVDEAGEFLITDRSLNAVTSDQACAIRLKWQPLPFREPGLAWLGAAAIISDEKILDPAAFTDELYGLASTNNVDPKDATAWVAAQWQSVAAAPYQNQSLQTAVYVRLVAAANTAPTARTPAQAGIVSNMETYIQSKRTYVAQTALDMYDAWKLMDDQERQSHKQSQVGQLFYYGTVPLDFSGMAAAILTPVGSFGAAGGGLIGSLVAAGRFAQAANYVAKSNAYGLYDQLRRGIFFANVLRGAQGAGAILSGASVIEIAGAVLSSIAIDQFIAITEARPRLEAALANAQQPVSLQALASTGDGQDLLKWYFTKAVQDGPQFEDPSVVALAQAGNAAAAKNGYRQFP